MLQLLLGLVDPLTGRVSRFKGPAALLVLNTRSVGWLPTALTNCGDAGPLAAALLGIAMGRAFDPRLCPILRGRLYLERIDHVSLVTLSPFWKEIADALEYTVVTQMGISFSIPVLIWIFGSQCYSGGKTLRPSCSPSLAKMRSTSNRWFRHQERDRGP